MNSEHKLVTDHIVHSLVDDILQNQNEKHIESNSTCESLSPCSSISFVDTRLQYWKNMFAERRKLQHRLSQATGKKPEKILFNLDYSNNDNKSLIMPPKEVAEPKEVPKVESGKQLFIDFSNTDVISWRLARICSNIYSSKSNRTSPSASISMSAAGLDNYRLRRISQLSKSTEPPELGLIINGTIYRPHVPEFSPLLERRFVCHPYEKSLRTVMRIENWGLTPITFRWVRGNFFAYNATLFNTSEDSFVFYKLPFHLNPSEVRDITILFRPNKVGIIKQRWILTTEPRIFFRSPCGLTLNIHGVCTPPQEYLELLESKDHLSAQVDLKESSSKPVNCLCPYSRQLTKMDAFNQRNSGFHCESVSDFLDITQFFMRFAAHSGLIWDYSVDMLINLVCAREKQQERAELFAQLSILLERVRGPTYPLWLCDSPAYESESNMTREIFVRGIIANCIDSWESMMASVENRMHRSMNQVMERKQRLSYKKSNQDALYILTYELLCNVIEDIVSVIDSS